MNLPRTTLSTVVLLTTALSGCTSPDSRSVVASAERLVELPIDEEFLLRPGDVRTHYIERGDTREAVLTACGRPTRVINANLWAYRNYSSTSEGARDAGFDTLLVAFAFDRVTALKLVDGDVLESELVGKAHAERLPVLVDGDR
jgi:hypothetical protein